MATDTRAPVHCIGRHEVVYIQRLVNIEDMKYITNDLELVIWVTVIDESRH